MQPHHHPRWVRIRKETWKRRDAATATVVIIGGDWGRERERAQVHAGGEPASRGATAAKGNIRQDADKNSLQETNFVDLVPTLSSGGYGWSLLASSMAVVANAGCR